MRHVLALATLAVVPLAMIVAETAKTTTPGPKKKYSTTRRKTTTTSKKTTAPSTKKGTTARRTTTATTRNRATATARPPVRTRQMQPAPERYKEIQQALATKGYLKSEATGAWNQESADALRRFQEAQNITASGKIDSLSLIALGLGPKRGTSAASPPAGSEPKPEVQPPALAQ